MANAGVKSSKPTEWYHLSFNSTQKGDLKIVKTSDDGKERAGPVVHKGKQTVKQLTRQGQELSNVELTDPDIKQFDRIARKYGVDYAVQKDASETPPKYMIFFKARDAGAITAAFASYLPSFHPSDADPYAWSATTISYILSRPEYMGRKVLGRTVCRGNGLPKTPGHLSE